MRLLPQITILSHGLSQAHMLNHMRPSQAHMLTHSTGQWHPMLKVGVQNVNHHPMLNVGGHPTISTEGNPLLQPSGRIVQKIIQ